MATSTSDPVLPTTLFSNIIPNLIAVVEHTQNPEGVVSPQAKQALLHATNDLRNTLAQAKDYAKFLPGGELNFQEQHNLIVMLEKLRDHKWQELVCFAHKAASDASPSAHTEDNIRMEVDSTASTPFGS